MSNAYFIVSAPIGMGKTTVTSILCKKFKNFIPIYETVKNHPTLEDYYRELKRSEESKIITPELKYYTWMTQDFFLWDRWHNHNQALMSDKHVVGDRSIYEDMIFAKLLKLLGYIEEKYYNRIYIPKFSTFIGFLKPPTLNINLKGSYKVALDRVAKRDRKMESGIPEEYMKKLCELYDIWINYEYIYPKIIIDTEKYNLTDENSEGWQILCEEVEKHAKDNKIIIERR